MATGSLVTSQGPPFSTATWNQDFFGFEQGGLMSRSADNIINMEPYASTHTSTRVWGSSQRLVLQEVFSAAAHHPEWLVQSDRWLRTCQTSKLF